MRHALLAFVPLVAGCIFTQADPPLLKVTSPKRSMILEEMGGMVTVTGIAAPNAGGAAVESVAVNGTPARLERDGSFTATVRVPPGGSLLQTVAHSADGGMATDTRSVVAGERRASGSSIPRAIAVQMAPSIFGRIAKIAASEIKQADLNALLARVNPIVSADVLGGCLGGQAYVDSLRISDAAVALVPVAGGLQLEATFQKPVMTIGESAAESPVYGCE